MRKIQIVLIAAIEYGSIAMAQMPSYETSIPKDPQFLGFEEILLYENDGGLYTAGAVPTYQCNTTITPSIQIVNSGSNTLTTAKLQYFIDMGSANYYDWIGELDPGEVDTILLPEMSVTAGYHMLSVSIIEANDHADINGGNNNGSVDFFIVGTSTSIPLEEDFELGVLPEGYFFQNPDGDATWNIYSDYEAMSLNNYLQMPFYHSYDQRQDNLYMKNLDLTNQMEAYLTFDLAYVYYSPDHFDQLRVLVSSDCGNDWNILYDKMKDELSTTSIEDGLPYSDIEFFPQNGQWRNEFVDLSGYAGNENVMVRFEGISGHGNNLYIDNIKVSVSVGIDEVQDSQVFFELYPNPSDDHFSISFKEALSGQSVITVTNMVGQNVYSSAANQSSLFDVPTSIWSEGVYLVNLLRSNAVVCSKQLIVKHQ